MDRLLANSAFRTDGKLTKKNLALEAEVSTATLYRHKSLLAEWDERLKTRTKSESPTISKLREEIAETKSRNRLLTEENAQLRKLLSAAATVIAELKIESQEVIEGSVAWLVPKRK